MLPLVPETSEHTAPPTTMPKATSSSMETSPNSTSPTSNSPFSRPQFSNPFGGSSKAASSGKIPVRGTVPRTISGLSTSSASSSGIDNMPRGSVSSTSGFRGRISSIFQSVSSNSPSSPAESDGAQSPMIRRQSYVPKYAARAHLSTMTGRSSIAGEAEVDNMLTRSRFSVSEPRFAGSQPRFSVAQPRFSVANGSSEVKAN